MSQLEARTAFSDHSHVFLGQGHEKNERKTWLVIWLCGFMMVAEIVGGSLFGSLALVADGLHMSTHAGALLLAALAYTYARKHATDSRFAFGTGKVGDLAGFTSAVILAMIALLIGYEAISRLLNPVSIDFVEAIPIAILGLIVNVVSAWLLSGGHHHGHGHQHGDAGESNNAHHEHGTEARSIDTGRGILTLEIFEKDVPPKFRARTEEGLDLNADELIVTTAREDGSRQNFTFENHKGVLESSEEIPEPHAFTAQVRILKQGLKDQDHSLVFEEHDHEHHNGKHAQDYNMRAAFIHVMADAAVSVMVIGGLSFAAIFGWLWMDPVAGLLGACVIASWSYGLIRDTGAILLDRTPDQSMKENIRKMIETNGDRLTDLHLWRLGPGHLGAIVSLKTEKQREPAYYRQQLARFSALSHVTVEVNPT